jgi:hypothetical protein
MAMAIGINMLDYYADPRTTANTNFVRTPEQFGELFGLVYNGLRELQAIELFNQPFWTAAYQHLLALVYARPQSRRHCRQTQSPHYQSCWRTSPV